VPLLAEDALAFSRINLPLTILSEKQEKPVDKPITSYLSKPIMGINTTTLNNNPSKLFTPVSPPPSGPSDGAIICWGIGIPTTAIGLGLLLLGVLVSEVPEDSLILCGGIMGGAGFIVSLLGFAF
jgi:hypothetical protein